jgi:hypothetical protein
MVKTAWAFSDEQLCSTVELLSTISCKTS